jgi:hypothetical protein
MNIATDPHSTGGAANCAQVDGRTLPATDMAEAVLQQVSSFPETHQQFHFFYFNNLEAPLPPTLNDSLKSLFNGLTAPAPYDLLRYSWLFTPNPALAMVMGPGWAASTQWQDVEDPSFEMALSMYAAQNLPYTSQTHDQGEPVPLLSAADVGTYAGGFLKICDSSPQVEPVYSSSGRTVGYGQTLSIKASDPPGYLVYFYPQIDRPGPSFTAYSASVDFQICTAYCDHPYVSTAGTGVTSWATSPLCAVLP